MTQIAFDRDEVLDELGYSSFYWNSWEKVRDWIRDMVQIEPKIMKRVAQRRFGALGNWIQRGSGNVGVCGCLVGSTALEMVKDRNHFKAQCGTGDFGLTKPIASFEPSDEYDFESYEVIELLAVDKQFVQQMEISANDAGMAASDLGGTLGQKKAVWLIKDEIIRQLKLRNVRVRAGRKSARQATRTATGQFQAAA